MLFIGAALLIGYLYKTDFYVTAIAGVVLFLVALAWQIIERRSQVAYRVGETENSSL
jgi:multisubunit Na+/H+ antiporter MnhE subunit